MKETGHLLKLGEKFSSQEAFLKFIGLPGMTKKKNLNGGSSAVDNNDAEDASDSDDKENEVFEAVVSPPSKKQKTNNSLDIDKLKEMLNENDNAAATAKKTGNNIHKTLANEARMKLTASRFRYLNEQLYTQPSNAAVKLFRSDSTLFTAYHQGYQHQAKQWPLDPLNVIV